MQTSSFPREGMWLKGNYHSHTTLSDGMLSPEEQLRRYKLQNYHFLAFTDHNAMNDRVQWNEGILMLPAWERDILYGEKTKCTHIVGLFDLKSPSDTTLRRPKGDKHTITDQALIDQMRKDGNVFISIAHPTWSRMEPEELLSLDHYHAIEVFNYGCECLSHEGHAEYLWDFLLRHGKRIFGIACDDTHGHTIKDDHFGGWMMVKSKAYDRQSIIEAMQAGHFYSTSGPEIHDWGIDEEGNAFITTSLCREIHFITYPTRGKSFAGYLTETTFPLKGGETYVRVECIDFAGNKAWTNPIFLQDR
ncbi:MAG: PHP domain-containing protein [Spirochaetales bacterium]|nr:PHP domain-containing protein [Spirochaetales bacterium]